MDIEFIDAKRFPSEEDVSLFYDRLAEKLSKLPPYDVILTADDIATKSAVLRQRQIFDDTPIIFYCVHDETFALEQNQKPNVTGVVESVSIKETAELAYHLSSAQPLIVVTDTTPGGQELFTIFREQVGDELQSSSKVLSLGELTFDEFKSSLNLFSDEHSLLLLSAIRDKAGVTLSFNEQLKTIVSNFPGRVFYMWQNGVGQGILGGIVISHFEQGKIAGLLTASILNGDSVTTLKVVEQSPNIPLFDYRFVEQHHISLSDLPADALFINKPPTGIVFSKVTVMLTGLILVLLAVLAIVFRLSLSRHRQMSAEVRESEAYYRSIFENALYGIAITDPDLKFVKVNDAWCQLIGYSERELLDNMGIADVTLPDNLPESMEMMERLIKREVNQGRLDKRYKTKSGEIIDAMTFVKGIYDNHGHYLGNAASILDITERKRAEEELRLHREHLEELVAARTQELEQSEEKYRALYNNSPGLMISVDALSKRVIECNETLLQRLGYARDEIIGKHVFDLYHPDSVDAAQKVFKQFLATDEVHNAELQLAKKGSGKIDVLLDVTAYVDKKTGRKYTLSIWRDITERKQMEHNLLQAKEEAERANQAKSVFLANMSHELRTPLNAVLGFSEMLARDPQINEKQKENLNIINRSGSYLLALINNVLDMSKIEAGRVELELEPVDLYLIVNDVSDMMRLRAETKHLQFVLEMASGLPQYVQLDMEKFRQLLINLLGNAIKFTEVGGVILRADANDLSNGQWQLRFEVEDSGIGIPADEIGTVFEPFIQAGHSARKQQGTGLGLAISRQFIHLMGGHITVESTINKGSVFRFEIPTEVVAAVEMKELVYENRQRVIGLAADEPEWRILIVEDDSNNRLLLRRLLEFVGFKVCEAVNGIEAIQQFQDWHPHLIWMDIRMPVMDGYEATRRIRTLPGGAQVIILALTASVFKKQEEEILAAGCNAVHHKPYNESDMFAAMGEHLGVHYIYEQSDKSFDEDSFVKLECDDLQGLPDEWLMQFYNTACLGDSEAMLILTNNLAAEHEEAKAKLNRAIYEFQFQDLIRILEQKTGSSD